MTERGHAYANARRGRRASCLISAGAAFAVIVAGCGAAPHDPSHFVGTWSSTESDAVITIHEDLSFEAKDYPRRLAPGGTCEADDVVREDFSGVVDPSTIDAGFVYVNGGEAQWWADVSWRGTPTLMIVPADCTEDLREWFEKE